MAAIVRAVVQNVDRLRAKLRKLSVDVQRSVSKALAKGAIDIQREAKHEIADLPKTGEIYKIYRKSGTFFLHQASGPGEAPAGISGDLMGAIRTASSDDGKVWYVYVSDDVPYGKWLELGTKNIKKRPFLWPAFKTHQRAISDSIKAAYHAAKPKGRT